MHMIRYGFLPTFIICWEVRATFNQPPSLHDGDFGLDHAQLVKGLIALFPHPQSHIHIIIYTAKALNKGHFETSHFVYPCGEVALFRGKK